MKPNQQNQSPIKAIETHYRGFTFRSRMEARWAVFMDFMKVPYMYEPEGYEFDGVCYLPDFYLETQDAFLEIKNPIMVQEDEKKLDMLVLNTKKKLFLITGPPKPWGEDEWYQNEPQATLLVYSEPSPIDGDQSSVGSDIHYLWCECPHCHRTELQFDGRADRIQCGCPKSEHGDKGYNYASRSLRFAYEYAAGFRFE